MATLHIRIEMENDAFAINRAGELKDIFDEVIANVCLLARSSGRVRDTNGNTVGSFAIGETPPALKSEED